MQSEFFEILELAGTFAFAVSGALFAAERPMDIFGVIIMAFAAAVSGGIVRDLISGAIPPEAFHSWHALATTTAAALLSFFCGPLLMRAKNMVQVFDAAQVWFEHAKPTNRSLSRPIVSYSVRKSVRKLAFLTGDLLKSPKGVCKE